MADRVQTNTGPEEVEIVDYHWSDRLPGGSQKEFADGKETSTNSSRRNLLAPQIRKIASYETV